MKHILALAALASLAATSSNNVVMGSVCSWTCSDECLQCAGRSINPTTGVQTVTVSAGNCKAGATISWMCCKTTGCAMTACDGDASGNKCDETVEATYTVPSGTNTLRIQLHDGRLAGDVNCGSTPGGCCGGSSSSCDNGISGVCFQTLQLSTCPLRILGECSTDSDCTASTNSCGVKVCSQGQCVEQPKEAGVECRAKTGACDIAEECDGTSLSCPSDEVEDSGVECRAKNGACDIAEECDGTNKACPSDEVEDAGVECRAKASDCDVAEECDGTNKACPANRPAPAGTECRAKAGDCDVAEKCSGSSYTCPTDRYAALGTTCRAAADGCDVKETCSGDSIDCPPDQRNDYSYTFKCAGTCFLCGVRPAELGLNNGGASTLADTTIGKCESFVNLSWPACESQCVNALCPNNRGLSNVAFFTCDVPTGDWVSGPKYEGDAVKNGVCPPWVSSGRRALRG